MNHDSCSGSLSSLKGAAFPIAISAARLKGERFNRNLFCGYDIPSNFLLAHHFLCNARVQNVEILPHLCNEIHPLQMEQRALQGAQTWWAN